jgi:hypothetical protein
MQPKNRHVYLLQGLLLLAPQLTARGNALSVEGMATDQNGNTLAGVSVTAYPVVSSSGKRTPPIAAQASSAASATTDKSGHFTISLEGAGAYHFCTRGAPPPTIDLCSTGQIPTLSVTPASGQHVKLVLQTGAKLTFRLRDPYDRITSGNTNITLAPEGARPSAASQRSISGSEATFVFSVPIHSSGRAIVSAPFRSVLSANGSVVPCGVPSIAWSADAAAGTALIPKVAPVVKTILGRQ